MPVREIYTVRWRGDGRWAVVRSGAQRASSLHSKKSDAVANARQRARTADRSMLVVHRKDGSIQSTVCFGPPLHMSELSGIGASRGGDVAHHKDEYLAEAIAADLR